MPVACTQYQVMGGGACAGIPFTLSNIPLIGSAKVAAKRALGLIAKEETSTNEPEPKGLGHKDRD